MIIDAREGVGEERIHCDVCVVGGGPAGIVVATELARNARQVVLLESGGTRFETKTHDLNRGSVTDRDVHGPLEDYRRRRLGGASTAWGGRCAPFDAIDYETRAYVPNSGWPFGKSAIDPYCARAGVYLELGDATYDAQEALPPAARMQEMIPGLSSDDVTTSSLYLFSPPTDFGARYRRDLIASSNARVYLHANCLEIVTSAEGARVDRIEAGTMNGRRFSVSAKHYVLASGGLEVARLMLASNRVSANGIGNQHDLLGRYYMCHMIHHLEVQLESDEVVWDYEKTLAGTYCQRTISVKQDKHRSFELLNHRARIEHPPIGDATHKNGVLSVAFLAKTLMRTNLLSKHLSPVAGTLSRGVIDAGTPEEPGAARRRLASHASNVARDFPNVLRFSRRWITERMLSDRKLPSIVLRSATNTYTLRLDAEQVPNPESRVTLTNDTDVFGQRRLNVDWRYTALDAQSLARAAALIGEAISRSGAGKVRSLAPVHPKATGGHHIGTTRMATSALRGVVDENCRVHGVGNLFIASSSVFPTSSYANPTLMVLALAIRLSDHLEKTLNA
jgi:choline dehydrogenase-like flavoprotein